MPHGGAEPWFVPPRQSPIPSSSSKMDYDTIDHTGLHNATPVQGTLRNKWLDWFINQLTEQDQTYFYKFLEMTNSFFTKSFICLHLVPMQRFWKSRIGYSLALVNAGWLLELATDAKKNTNINLEKSQVFSRKLFIIIFRYVI